VSVTPEDADRFFENLLLPPDAFLDQVLARTQAAGLPPIAVSPLQGAFLRILAAGVKARRILEIGALGGYSTVWLARALPPEGLIVTLDINPVSVAVTAENAAAAGLGGCVRVIEGPAAASLEAMIARVEPAFDLIFIDADKAGYPRYLDLCLKLVRPGSLIVADNVVREGAVADPATNDAAALGVRRYLELARANARLTTTVLQTVGAKGHDGFALSLVG
jgi:predicted O-methyltransferase YrrM